MRSGQRVSRSDCVVLSRRETRCSLPGAPPPQRPRLRTRSFFASPPSPGDPDVRPSSSARARSACLRRPARGPSPPRPRPCQPRHHLRPMSGLLQVCERWLARAHRAPPPAPEPRQPTRTAPPPESPSYGSFTELVERNNQTLHRIVDRLAAGAPANPKTAEQKLGAFYGSCMDSTAIERAGADPLKNELARLDGIKSREDVTRALARGHHHGWDPLFNFGGTPDFKNSALVIAAASQGGLGLPDRDYYVRDDSTARNLRAAYLE